MIPDKEEKIKDFSYIKEKALADLENRPKVYGSSEFLSGEAKREYDQIYEAMAARPALTKLLAIRQYVPYSELIAIQNELQLQILEEILKVLRNGGCSCGRS